MRIEDKNIIGRVECLGSKRQTFEQSLNEEYGQNNWGYGWLVEVENEDGEFTPVLLNQEEIIEYYLGAYILLAAELPWVFERLVEQAAEVFELDRENDPLSGTSFFEQHSSGTHYMDIAVRVVVEQMGLSFQGHQMVHINDGGTPLPEDIPLPQAKTWFDVLNPSKLRVGENIKMHSDLSTLKLLTNPCTDGWAERSQADQLTAESLYQFTRVVWVK